VIEKEQVVERVTILLLLDSEDAKELLGSKNELQVINIGILLSFIMRSYRWR
jgi:hypothetical protein